MLIKSTLPLKEPNVKAETEWKSRLARSELSERVRRTLLAHQQAVASFANAGTVTQSTFLRDRGFGLLAAWMRVLERLRIIPADTGDL
jgi:hypothetical protein